MEVATMASHSFPLARLKLSQTCSSCAPTSSSSCLTKPSLPSTPFLSSSSMGGSVSAAFSLLRIRPASLNPYSPSYSRGGKRGVVTTVIPFSRGSAWEQPPPDLASYLYKNRIVYLGMSLVPSVTELILAEFLYLQYEDEQKPIYLYINSTKAISGWILYPVLKKCNLLD
ncbi:ATP-dependent Clp protease proteolytic subunit-related protein 4, chloroplastic-like isoform X2 [Coffea eugenioides]|uniref:ATP-dependent Clp protease proteolytic subunit-related protein 4, chloroplastic-like isoform X2 n=1 Tax=Coffea eugenioides TaxID=49369 RepID=UPI000F612964|nr:ATP-dependent Clp protease proteolytic subunit-related protein 4, chloroplastic-like isoform X2 [Coffea eugenioides]